MAHIGDRVFICDPYWKNKVFNGNFKPEYGTVIKQYQSDDKGWEEWPIRDDIMEVRGDNGRKYTDEKSYPHHKMFFTEQEFAGAVKDAIKAKEREIEMANKQLGSLKSLLVDIDRRKELQALHAGEHGTCSWTIDREGTMKIFPTNGRNGILAEPTVYGYRGAPWREFSDEIKKVVIEKGVSTPESTAFLFDGLKNCSEMDLSNLNMNKTRDAFRMFSLCKNLTSLDFSATPFWKLKDASGMFLGCAKLTSIKGLNFDSVLLNNTESMFEGCWNLKDLEMKGFNPNKSSINMENMFDRCSNRDELERQFLDKSREKRWKPSKRQEKTKDSVGIDR